MCVTDKKNTAPGQHGAAKPRKKGEYGNCSCRRSRRPKFIYGVMEKQFHNYYLKAEKMAGIDR